MRRQRIRSTVIQSIDVISCKNKLNLDEIHNEILKELSSKWYVMLENLEHTLAKLMTKGKSKIEEHRNSIKNQLQVITLKEEFLINEPEKVNQNSDWDFILSISKPKLNREIFKANTFIEHINLLTDGFHSNQIFTLLKLNNL